MKLIIFGATGTVGQHLTSQALDLGHEVTAFARKPEKLNLQHCNLAMISGDVLDQKSVDHAMSGHEAVIIALGAGRKGGVRSKGTENIIASMTLHGVRRLICQSTLGAGDSEGNLNFFWKHIMFGLLLKDAYHDHQSQEALVRESGLDWTIIRPSAFTNEAATGAYRHGFSASEKNLKLKIPRADVAGFMLQQLTDNTYLRQSPSLSF